MTLEEQRDEAAQAAFEKAPLDGLADFDRSWARDGNYWSRQIYWEAEDGGDSVTGSFGVEFKPGSPEIIDQWWQ